MKVFKQLLIILLVYFLGESISKTFSLPVPGNILGMLLLLISLCTGIIKLHHIEEVSDFLIKNMAFFFIPAGVGIITSLSILKTTWYKLFIICLLSTIIVIVVTGLVTQSLKKYFNRSRENE